MTDAAMASEGAAPMGQNLTVQVAGGEALDVRHFIVTEGLSMLFEVQLEVVSQNPDVDFAEIVGKPARFTLHQAHAGGEPRTWIGVCSHIEQLGVEESENGLSTYALSIMPTLWLLSHRRNHRMFQQKSEPRIVLDMLAEWGIEVEPRVDMADYPTREYRLQYGETDFAFISRMLEDAGITYFFETVDDRPVMVISDEPTRRAPRPPLPYVADHDHPVESEYVTDLRIARQVRPGRYTQRDVDHRRAPTFPVVASAANGLDVESRLERFHYNPGAFLFQQSGGGDSPVGDDRGVHRADLGRGAEQTRRRLDAKRGSARTVLFRAQATALRPGEVMTVVGHPRSDLGANSPLLVVSASHEGDPNSRWSHRFEARFADIPYRPPLETPKPIANGVESATVVGPAGEEIHTDEHGRVRVHFHWDRESQMNEQSSCWVPVSHPWAGTGYGGMNIPRVGQEVVISFLGGDPDRPLAVGRVYTSLQRVPYELPANKTQSGWRSNSSPATGGYNEMMFEDAAGREVVRFRAERNFTGLVQNDSAMVIGNDSVANIGRHDIRAVGMDQTLLVGRDRVEQVGRDHLRVAERNVLQQSRNGTTLNMSKHTTFHKDDERIVLNVGTSTIVMLPDKIVIQADDVFINPGSPAPPPPPAQEGPSILQMALLANPITAPAVLAYNFFFGSP
jgi:type VI secretion system secreted protein VgrG